MFSMRIAIVSDIHGNLTALKAVVADLREVSPDLVLHGGDLVTNGHHGAEVIDTIRALGWRGVLGNTDELLWTPEKKAQMVKAAPKLTRLMDVLFGSTGPAARSLIGEERVAWLQSLPLQIRQDDLLLMHASPNDLWRAPMPDCSEAELVRIYGSCQAKVVVYGHIHRAYVRSAGDLAIANSGSVGLPYDGDPRAAYLVISQGKISIRRVQYEIESEVKELLASGYPYAPWLAAMRRTARYVPPF
jgi:putative phosphoesterase